MRRNNLPRDIASGRRSHPVVLSAEGALRRRGWVWAARAHLVAQRTHNLVAGVGEGERGGKRAPGRHRAAGTLAEYRSSR